MKYYLKYSQYIFLVLGIYFIYDGIIKLNSGNDTPYLSFFMASMAIAMFFFRRKFAKKFDNQEQNK